MDLPPPIPCSDDVGEENASFGTAREVPTPDLSTDSERAELHAPPRPAGAFAAGAGYGGGDGRHSVPKGSSHITISDMKFEGIPEAMRSGMSCQLGQKNHMIINRKQDGSSTPVTTRITGEQEMVSSEGGKNLQLGKENKMVINEIVGGSSEPDPRRSHPN